MSEIALIRKQVFRQTQRAFGAMLGVTQGTISRWEAGEIHPSLDQLGAIRAEAMRRNLAWNDTWFFEASQPLVEHRT